MTLAAFPGFLRNLFRRDGIATVGKIFRYGVSPDAWHWLFDNLRYKRWVKAARLVDEGWYRREYPEVAEKGLDPVQDFLTPPHVRLRMPNPDFVPLEYEALHYDVKQCDVPPAVHFARDGRREGRAVSTLEHSGRPFPDGAVELRRAFAPAPVRHRRTAIFAAFCGDGRIPETTLSYLRGLREVSDNIVFVANSPVFPDEADKLDGLVRLAVFRHHGCYDFGSYKAGWTEARTLGLLEAAVCDELILCNDSCFGPVFPFSESFAEMARRNRGRPADDRFDFWGMTAHELFGRPHVQSYFYVFGKSVLETGALDRFFAQMGEYRERGQVVWFCETRLSEALCDEGLRFDSLVPPLFSREHKAPPIKFPVTLLSSWRMPLLKAKTLRGESKESLVEAVRLVRAANPELAALLPETPSATSFDGVAPKSPCDAVRAVRERHPAALEETLAGLRTAARPVRMLFLTRSSDPFPGGAVLEALRGRPGVLLSVAAVPDFRIPSPADCFATLRDVRSALLSRFGESMVVRAMPDAAGVWTDLTAGADVVCYDTADGASDFRYNPHYALGRPFLPVLLFDRRTAGPYPLEKEFARPNYAYFWKIFFTDREALDLYARHSLRKGGNAVVVEAGGAAEALVRMLRTEPAE